MRCNSSSSRAIIRAIFTHTSHHQSPLRRATSNIAAAQHPRIGLAAVRFRHLMTTTAAAAAPLPPPPPQHPKVGVGVILLRHLKESSQPDVLLIKRGKPPSLGSWSFCGGTLELGETLVQCAIREAKEETGLTLRCLTHLTPTGKSAFYPDLRHPAVFAAVDVIDRDTIRGTVRYHYAVVEVAAVPDDPRAVPVAADDAADVQWISVDALHGLPDLVPNAIEVVEEALSRFQPPRE